ncbi:MAG TPA: hemerythrin domain-containing protein [Bryobacteraceae bacterium]|nr:hemerythrin domain-containing protein [Bryobacteraceae bacterium]
MNVLEMLRFDHQSVDKIFHSIMLTSSSDKAKREELFGALKEALIKHAHAEEKVFYPPLREKQQAHDIIEEGIHEHHSVEDQLQKMSSIPADSDDWLDAVQHLKDSVQHHVQEEENEIFPKAEQLLGSQRLDQMGDEVEQAKQQEGPIH